MSNIQPNTVYVWSPDPLDGYGAFDEEQLNERTEENEEDIDEQVRNL